MDCSLGTAQGSGTGGASLGETMSTEIASVASEFERVRAGEQHGEHQRSAVNDGRYDDRGARETDGPHPSKNLPEACARL